MPGKVLFVDDEPQVTEGLKRSLRKEPFELLTAQSAKEALEIIMATPVDVVVTDEMMPGMTGSELLAEISESHPDIYQIVLTGQASLDATLKAINDGRLFKFLTKPCSRSCLASTIQQAIEEKSASEALGALAERATPICSLDWDLKDDRLRWSRGATFLLGLDRERLPSALNGFLALVVPDDRSFVQERVEACLQRKACCEIEFRIQRDGGAAWISLTCAVVGGDEPPARLVAVLKDVTTEKVQEDSLRSSVASLREAILQTVRALSVMTEKKDSYTAAHQERVARIACGVGREMGLGRERIEGLHAAGLLHDIGKICIPAEYLAKTGVLTAYERAIIRSHAEVGYDVLKDIPFPWPIAQAVLQHHERLDGSGYPRGLRGEDICLEARILGMADVVEAMSSHRPYRAALGLAAAKEEIRKNRGVLYDPKTVDACLAFLEKEAESVS